MIMTLPSNLAPMPIQPSDGEAMPAWCKSGEFVDESRLALLIGTPLCSRTIPMPDDLVLTADENDFAGWMLPTRTPPLTNPEAKPAALPRETAATLEIPDEANHPTSSWWICSSAGAFCTLLFAFLLLTLAWRPPAIAAGAALPVTSTNVDRTLSQSPAATLPATELAAGAPAAH